MSNVFTYPNNEQTNYINPDDDIYIGALQRARYFLAGNDSDTIYSNGYRGGTSPMANLPNRTPEGLARHVSNYRGYYGVASNSGVDGLPSYLSVYNEPFIYTYFYITLFGITNAYPNPTTGTLTLDCKREHGSTHPSNLPYFATTNTHGMGNSSLKYTDTYARLFQFQNFDESVAGEWGNYLNFLTNGGTEFYLKVVDALSVEVYTDSGFATPVNIGPSGLNWSAYTSGGVATIANGQPGSFQCLVATLYDQGNISMSAYDSDYYSGYGNSVNNDFGANIVGARTSWFVKSTNTSRSSFDSNVPVDYASIPNPSTDSDFNPEITVVCAGDGAPLTGVGTNGVVTGATLNPELAGMMVGGGDSFNQYSDFSQCAVKIVNNVSDAAAGFDFSISNITQASPAVVTFANSIKDLSADGNVRGFKSFINVGGMTEINGELVYLKQTSHNTAEIYNDEDFTLPHNSIGYGAYTSGGELDDYDNNELDQITVFGADYTGRTFLDFYQNYAPLSLDVTNQGSFDQVWPSTVSPAKMNMTVIHPTRKTYAQDLTRYTNSTGAVGYRLSVTYNNISVEAWRELDSFIKQMRGGSAPFRFNYTSASDGGGYSIFSTNQNTINTWNAGRPILARRLAPGSTAVYLTGFKAEDSLFPPGSNGRIVSRSGDIFSGLHSYRSSFTFNNVATAGGEFQTNQFGEAIIRFTHPIKNELGALNGSIAPFNYTYFQCMLADDEVEYDWHPTGNFVSFSIDMDVV
jgi:hypothetical protein